MVLQGWTWRHSSDVAELQTDSLVEWSGTASDTGCKPRRRKRKGSVVRFLSTAGHVEPCGNPGGPSPKTKYVPATDSEPVP